MSEILDIKHKPKERLKFIDMARSIAILMMIEGHFTGAALGTEYRDYKYLSFEIWHIIHGLTSPLFFTITGVIFAYLLIGNKPVRFLDNARVKRGKKRIFQLLFWGYIIQLNLWSIGKSIYYDTEFHLEWFYAFHVLQSIAICILFVILIYGVYKVLNFGKLHWYYLTFGLIAFAFYAMMKGYIRMDEKMISDGLKSNPAYWPKHAPQIIQNMFYGPFSTFSWVRMAGYSIFGAMLGSIIKTNEAKVKKWWFGFSFIFFGLLIAVEIQSFFQLIDHWLRYFGVIESKFYELNTTSFSRLGQVVVLIGILILIDKYFKIKSGLFLKIGQSTFPIYVVHVIILYSGFFGFGLSPLAFHRNLNPGSAIAISISALIFFVVMVKYIEPLQFGYDTVLYKLRLKKRPIEKKI